MKSTGIAASTCPVARSLSVLGERWSLLVVREAFLGRSRFSEFQDRLGVAPDVLTDRLRTLVEAGVLVRDAYREPGARERFAYFLTPAGRELAPVLGALATWGESHLPDARGARWRWVGPSGDPALVGFATSGGDLLAADEVALASTTS